MVASVAAGAAAAPLDAVGAPVPAAAAPAEAWVSELAAWRVLEEQAARMNRNLLQYAASLAAMFGIFAGSGSVLALAEAVGKQPLPLGVAIPIALVGAVVLSTLATLVWTTFRARGRTERAADEHLARLIRLKPAEFLSSAKGR